MIKLILFSLLIMPRLVVGIGDEVCSIIKYTKDITKEASEEYLPSRKRIEWSKLINLATDGIDTIECYKLKKSHSVLFGSRVFKFENYLFDKKKSKPVSQNEKDENKITKTIDGNQRSVIREELEKAKKETDYKNDSSDDPNNKIDGENRMTEKTEKAVESGAVISELNVKHPSNVNNATKLKPNKKTVNKESVEYNKDYPNSFKKQKTKEATNANEDKNFQNNDDKQNLNKDENESEEMANLLDMQYSKKEISKVEEKDSQSQDNHERGNINDTGKTEIKLSEEKEQDFEKTKIPGTNMTTEMPNEEDSEQSANELSTKFEIESTIKDDLSSVESSTNPDKHNVKTNKKTSEETENRKSENSVKNIINNIAKPKNSQLESLKQESNVDLQQVIDDKEVVRIDKINEYEINKKDKNIIDSKSQTETLLQIDNEKPSQTIKKSSNERNESSNETVNDQERNSINGAGKTEINLSEEKEQDFEKTKIPGTNMTTKMSNEEDSEQSANELSKKFEIESTIKDDLSSVESSTNPDKHNVETNKKTSEETENIKSENSVKNIINNIAKPKNGQLKSSKRESNKDSQQVIDKKELARKDKINEYEINIKDKNITDSKSQTETLLQTDNENPSQTGTKSQNERREPSNENLDEIKQEIKNLTIGNQVRRIEKVQNDFKKKEIKKESEKNNQQDSQLSYMESKTNVLRPQPKDQKTKSKKSKKLIKTKSPITKKENSIKRETDPKLTAKNQLIDRSGAKGHINIRDNNTNERPIEELPKPSKTLSKTAKNKSVKGDKDDTNDTNTSGTGQSEQPHINEMNKTISKNLSNNSFTEKKFIKKEDFSRNQIENQECKSKQISVFYEIINYYKHNPKVQKSKVQKEEFQVKGKSINDQRKYEPPLLNLEQFSNTIDSHLSELLSESEKRISAAFSSRLSKFQRGISRLEYKLTILYKKLENIVTSQNNLEKKLLTIEQPHSQTSQCEPLLKEIRENIIQLKNLTRDLLMEKQKKNENVIYPENPKITLKNLHPEIIFLPCQFLQIVGFKICCIETKRITVKKISDKPRIVYENLKSCYGVKMEERIIKIILNDNKDLTKECLCRNKSLVILQRRSGNVNFTRKWNEYKYGFGKLSDSFWIGLEFLHQLTKSDLYKLNIHIKDWDNNTFYARYDQFKINSENNGYQLYVKGYSGNSGDSLVPHNGKRFSTIDVDHDEVSVKFGGSCSNRFRGGWWYYSCYKCNPTGVFYEKGEVASQMFDGISWKTLRPPNYSFQEFVMSITSL